MTRAVISGSLVDAKNVQTHKCVRLYIDVPAELGEQIVQMFGWPTMAAPVPVAIARLVEEPKAATKDRQWAEISPAEQAGMRCNEWRFRRFLKAKDLPVEDPVTAAHAVRTLCGVKSRSELNYKSQAAEKWRGIEREYQKWLPAPIQQKRVHHE